MRDNHTARPPLPLPPPPMTETTMPLPWPMPTQSSSTTMELPSPPLPMIQPRQLPTSTPAVGDSQPPSPTFSITEDQAEVIACMDWYMNTQMK